jgi:transglutaminase-like putative cysteine protease
MRFRVLHTTRYAYSRSVFLEPHTLRLRPRSDPSQRLVNFDLSIEPRPAVLAEGIGPEGDPVAYAAFKDTTESLVVRAQSETETLRANPFDYLLLTNEQAMLPMSFGGPEKKQLSPFLSLQSRSDSSLGQLAGLIASQAQGETLRFLSLLTERIYRDWDIDIREEGDAYPPEQTFQTQRGACRDVAVMFVECCRLQGIAARFVSGYQEGEQNAGERFMHAWAEVYIPGGGWRGYDPTHGLAVADRHIAVAAAADARLAAPIEGIIRGTGATSSIEAEIKIEVL